MGYFKEELRTFENLAMDCRLNGGFVTGRNDGHLANLRELMTDLADLRIGKYRKGNLATDTFFIAYEQDGPNLTGARLEVHTIRQTDGSRKVTLSGIVMQLPTNCYDRFKQLNG